MIKKVWFDNEGRERITVCASCLRASCWQGVFMCEDAKTADITEMFRSDLERLALESPDYWEA